MEPNVLYGLLAEIKGDVGEIKGTMRAVAAAGDAAAKRIEEHDARLESIEISHRELQASTEAVKAYRGRLIAITSAAAGTVTFLVNFLPKFLAHF